MHEQGEREYAKKLCITKNSGKISVILILEEHYGLSEIC